MLRFILKRKWLSGNNFFINYWYLRQFKPEITYFAKIRSWNSGKRRIIFQPIYPNRKDAFSQEPFEEILMESQTTCGKNSNSRALMPYIIVIYKLILFETIILGFYKNNLSERRQCLVCWYQFPAGHNSWRALCDLFYPMWFKFRVFQHFRTFMLPFKY